MKEFIKNAGWVDWVLVSTAGILILGFILFVVGFFWGFEASSLVGVSDIIDVDLGKTNVNKILSGDFVSTTFMADIDTSNLFTLAGDIDSSMGPLFGMVITSLVGFSLIMLSILIVVVLFIVSIFMDYIWPKIKAKKQK